MSNNPIISVKSSDLSRASRRLNEPAQSLREALTNFFTVVAPLGPRPWGENDEMAQLFDKEYVNPSQLVLEAIDAWATGIQGLRGKVKLMQQRLVDLEDSNSN